VLIRVYIALFVAGLLVACTTSNGPDVPLEPVGVTYEPSVEGSLREGGATFQPEEGDGGESSEPADFLESREASENAG